MRNPTNRQKPKITLKWREFALTSAPRKQHAHHPPAVSRDRDCLRCCDRGHHRGATGRVLSPKLHNRAAHFRTPSGACRDKSWCDLSLPFHVNPNMAILAKWTERLRSALERDSGKQRRSTGHVSVHSYELDLREKVE